MQDGLAKIGAGILGVLVAGFKTIQGLIERIWGDREKGNKLLEEARQQSLASTDYIIEGVQGMGKGFSQGLKGVLGIGTGVGKRGTGKSEGAMNNLFSTLTGGKSREASIPQVTGESEARLMFLTRATLDLNKRLMKKGVDEETARELALIYKETEEDTGKGEVAFERAARRKLKGREDVESISRMARSSEVRAAGVEVRDANNNRVQLEVFVRTRNGYSGQAEGR